MRKYISVLELFYAHVQEVNTLLVKQMEVIAKHCAGQLTPHERVTFKVRIYAFVSAFLPLFDL